MGMRGKNSKGPNIQNNDSAYNIFVQFSEDGKEIIDWKCEVKPQGLGDTVKAPAKASPCSGCGGEKIEPPRTPEDNEAILRDGIA